MPQMTQMLRMDTETIWLSALICGPHLRNLRP